LLNLVLTDLTIAVSVDHGRETAPTATVAAAAKSTWRAPEWASKWTAETTRRASKIPAESPSRTIEITALFATLPAKTSPTPPESFTIEVLSTFILTATSVPKTFFLSLSNRTVHHRALKQRQHNTRQDQQRC
jgi:hypothetical protein